MTPSSSPLLEQIFHNARTIKEWQDTPVPPETLQKLWTLTALGPTSYNCSPLRVRFIVSPEAKRQLVPHLMEGNIPQVEQAPVTAILANDLNFHEHFETLVPGANLGKLFAGDDNKQMREITAMRNGSLQGAYFIIAARSLGLDCGPMSGFNNQTLDDAFFPQTSYRSNFLCNIGYGKRENLRPRSPRLNFQQATQTL
ncbi:MAG: malonic semialdehyde reductase [Alphaproteobacteria bacterium]